MESHQSENRLTEIPDSDTLHELLARLNELDSFKPVSRTENITVEDVAEALHLDPDYVTSELEAIFEEHRNARLAGVLRELEEPLYRVERTGHAVHDPLGNPLYKLRSVQILAERNREKAILPRRKLEDPKSEQLSNLVGKFMIYLMAGLMVVLAGKTIIMMLLAK